MKTLSVAEVAKAVNLSEAVIKQNIKELIGRLASPQKHYLLNDNEKYQQVFVVTEEDLNFIITGIGIRNFTDLVVAFNLTSRDLNWLLPKLNEEDYIDKKVLEYYMNVKSKPSVRAWFEPSEVSVGDKVTLNIDITAPCDILEPTLSIENATDLELQQEPKVPEKILTGKLVNKYQYEATSHGIITVGVILGGIIEEIAFGPQRVTTAELKKLPLLPKIDASSTTASYASTYLVPFTLNLDISNSGNGTAQNVQLRGLEKQPMFEAKGPTMIGNVAPRGSNRFKISLKPKKSGTYSMDKLSIYYEDLIGRPSTFTIPKFEVAVDTPQPKIKVDILKPELVQPKRVFNMTVRVANNGAGEAKSIVFTVPIEQNVLQGGNVDCTISRLPSNVRENITFQLEAPSSEDIKIPDFEINIQDAEGKPITETAYGTVIQVEKGTGMGDGPINRKVVWPFYENAIIAGQYQIVKEVGEGGFARVYRVRRPQFQEETALKALKPEYIMNSVMVDNFIQEAKTMKQLTEEHIISINYVGIEKNENSEEFPYIIMEYISGGTLQSKLQEEKTLGLMESVFLINDICSALRYAHQKNMAHFDVKPSNIFCYKKNGWKLGDFGLSKTVGLEGAIGNRGSLKYMAPEIREGKGSTKSDVYSLGKVFTEILTGDINGEVRKLKVKSENIGKLEKIADIIDSMLKKNASDRPSIAKVQDALTEFSTWG
jgi:tRNA A-37 threonylcarbamoyl transferase component Bud32